MAIKGLRLELNHAEFERILNSQGVREDLERRGHAIANAAGGEAEGFVVEPSVAPDRVAVQVSTNSHEARRKEAEDRALLRALDAGR